MKPTVLSSLVLALGLALTGPSAAGPSDAATQSAATTTGVVAAPRVAQFQDAMRKLWEDHITYTRNYIISALADLPDQAAVAARLLANQDEIGDAIKPFYGEAAGNQLAALLRDHILIATEVVAAAKAGDAAQLEAAQAEWYANASDIAAFLSAANPNWNRQELETALRTHLDLTTGEVVSRLNQDWDADIRFYDAGHAHMLMFADTLTLGIARQFPSQIGK